MSERWLVVGAGSAGCVVAGRMAEDASDGPDRSHRSRSVTLLEAGPDLAPGSVPPEIDGADALRAAALPGRTWSTPVVALPDGSTRPYLRGRGVGGSSAVNAMLAGRGDDADRWGWRDAETAWGRVAIPVERAEAGEVGPIDRALLEAAPDARLAPLTRRGGRRVTSAEAYLWPALRRGNLQVRAGATVERVLIEDRRAVGVVLTDGDVIAADRVVLAAGAVHTPAILLRSGVDTPDVGAGLQDHPSAAITLEIRGGTVPGGLLTGAVLDRGPLQILPMNHTGDDAVHAAVAVALMRPVGRHGRVSLGADASAIEPHVELDPFADRRDLESLHRGVRILLELLRGPSFREIVAAAYVDEHGSSTRVLDDDESLDRWLRSTPGVYVHASSTCPIGTVLDDDGAVVGHRGLFVCDASAFPSVPSVWPHLPTTMLAERLVARWCGSSPT